MSKLVFVLLLAVLAALAVRAHAAPVRPEVPCDRPVFVFGDATVLGKGVRVVGATDLVSRLKVFFRRACHKEVPIEVVAQEHGRLVDEVAAIGDVLARKPGALALVHFPFTDVESGVSVDSLLAAYRRLGEACRQAAAICVVGGQQPVESLPKELEARQLEIEHQASATLGAGFLPLYRYFQSEADSRQLMVPLDSGNGRFVNDTGHELLFELYRRRLIELVRGASARSDAARSGSTVR